MIRWVARLAILTVLLGLAGTIAIISYLHTKHPYKEERKKEQEAVPEKDGKADSPIINSQTKPLPTVTSPKPVVVEKKEGKRKSEEKLKDEGKTVDQNKLTKAQDEKLFNQDELQELVSRINLVKEEHSIRTNCVQIYTTVGGNNKRAVSQVETFLRSKRFAIAGRETISKKIKGILVTAVGECIRLTIGSF